MGTARTAGSQHTEEEKQAVVSITARYISRPGKLKLMQVKFLSENPQARYGRVYSAADGPPLSKMTLWNKFWDAVKHLDLA